MSSSLEGEKVVKLENHENFKRKKNVLQTCPGFRWAFTADTWMNERDNFEDFDLRDAKVDGVYYTGSKSHPW